jgi:hypothetical protein
MDHPSGSIEHIVLQAMGELGFANPLVRGQTFLLRDRQVVGRRFCFEGVEAVWLTAEGQVKFYGDGGRLPRVVDVGDEQGRKAA